MHDFCFNDNNEIGLSLFNCGVTNSYEKCSHIAVHSGNAPLTLVG